MKTKLELGATLENLDGVHENFRSLYTEQEDGTYTIGETHGKLIGAIQGLQKALTSSREAEKAAKSALSSADDWSEFGTPDDVRTMKADLEAKIKAASKGSLDIEKVRSELKKANAEAMTAKDAELEKMRGKLRSNLVESQALQALSKHKGSSKVLLPHIMNAAKVVETADGYEIVIPDADGDVRINATGAPMTIDDLVAEMRASDDFGMVFQADDVSGTGAPANGAGGPVRFGKSPAEMTSLDKIAAGFAQRRGRR